MSAPLMEAAHIGLLKLNGTGVRSHVSTENAVLCPYLLLKTPLQAPRIGEDTFPIIAE